MRLAEDVVGVDEDEAVAELLADHEGALVGADGPPAFGGEGLVALLADGDVDDVEGLVADREFGTGRAGAKREEERCPAKRHKAPNP